MPYTLDLRGTILTVRVTKPTHADVPSGLGAIQRSLDADGITEVCIAYDEAAWQTGWAVCTLTAFEETMAGRGIPVRIIGHDPRLQPSGPAS